MQTTGSKIKYLSSEIDLCDLLDSDIHYLRHSFYDMHTHKIPKKGILSGEKLSRVTYLSDSLKRKYEESLKIQYAPERLEEVIAFYTTSMVSRVHTTKFSPPKNLILKSRFDPYMPVLWIKEFAHNPWEPVDKVVEWVLYRIQHNPPTYKKMHHKEIIWKVHENYLDLQKALVSKGFLLDHYSKKKKSFSFSLIVT